MIWNFGMNCLANGNIEAYQVLHRLLARAVHNGVTARTALLFCRIHDCLVTCYIHSYKQKAVQNYFHNGIFAGMLNVF